MALAAPFPSVRTTPARRTSSTRTSSSRTLAMRPSGARPSVARTPQGRMRLTVRGRVAVFGAGLIAILGIVAVSSQVADATTASGSSATAVVVVQAGDSLWSIAQQVSSNVDPREMVSRIRELNALDGSVVVAGQSLVVPVA
jgi:LysM repeat protein